MPIDEKAVERASGSLSNYLESIYEESIKLDIDPKASREKLISIAYQIAVEDIYEALRLAAEDMTGSDSTSERTISLGVAAAAIAVDKFRGYVEKEAEYSQRHDDGNGDDNFGTTADD